MASLTWITGRTALRWMGGGSRGAASAAIADSLVFGPTTAGCNNNYAAPPQPHDRRPDSGRDTSRAYFFSHLFSTTRHSSFATTAVPPHVKATPLLQERTNQHNLYRGGGPLNIGLSNANFHHQNHLRVPPSHSHHHPQQQQQRRWYTPMTPDEEAQEKVRVAGLSEFAKVQVLRQLNREIARLEMRRGINTGELYTWSGRYKVLARDYGMPLFAWYWACWVTTAVLCYGAVTIFNVDALSLLAQMDAKTGWSLVDKVDPTWGKLGLVLILNEAMEPLRMPIVIVTVKPVMDRIAPPKF